MFAAQQMTTFEGDAGYARPELFAEVAAEVRAGKVVVVVGEAGVGKSRLASEVATVTGHRVLQARFTRPGMGGSPLVGLLACAPVDVARLLDQAPAMTRRRVRRLRGDQLITQESDTEQEQLAALVEFVRSLREAAPTVLVLDDVHWASPEERLTLEALVGPAGGPGGVLLLSRTPVEGLGRQLRLESLHGPALNELVNAFLPGADESLVSALTARTGGLPLLVEQCARQLVREGSVVRREGGCRLVAPERLASLPVDLRAFVAQRLADLPEQAQQVVRLASVIGEVAELDLLRHLTGAGTALEGLVAELAERGLLRLVMSGQREAVGFRHDVLREVAETSLGDLERRHAHRAAAEWYAVFPVVTMLSEEARHLEAALALGESDCAAVRRAVEVLGHYAASVLDERTALALDVVGRAEAIAAEHPRCAVDLLPLLATKASGLLQAGEELLAAEVAEAVLAEAERTERLELAVTAARCLASARTVAGTPDAVATTDRALALAERADDPVAVARALTVRAEAAEATLSERIEAWTGTFRAAIRGGDTRLASLASQDLALHLGGRDPVEATRWRHTAQEGLREDDVVGRARVVLAEANVLLMCDDVVASAATAASAAGASREAQSLQLWMNSALLELEALILAGQLTTANARYAELLEVAVTRPTPRLRVDASMTASVLLNRLGRGAEARALLEEVKELALGTNTLFIAQWHSCAARCAQESGDFTAAVRLAAESARLYLELDLPAMALREQLVGLASRFVAGLPVALADLAGARSQARHIGAAGAVALLGRWGELADALKGLSGHQVDVPNGASTAQTRALDLEIAALRTAAPELLLDAAEQWSTLGKTVWQARALLWHTELTGHPHPEAEQMLLDLAAPAGLAGRLRQQVRGR